jgi:hypothetical protein
MKIEKKVQKEYTQEDAYCDICGYEYDDDEDIDILEYEGNEYDPASSVYFHICDACQREKLVELITNTYNIPLRDRDGDEVDLKRWGYQNPTLRKGKHISEVTKP